MRPEGHSPQIGCAQPGARRPRASSHGGAGTDRAQGSPCRGRSAAGARKSRPQSVPRNRSLTSRQAAATRLQENFSRGHVRRAASHEGKKRSLLQSLSASGCVCMWLPTQGGSAARLAAAASVRVPTGVRALGTSAVCAKPRRQRNRNNPFPLNAMKHFAYDDIPTFGHV